MLELGDIQGILGGSVAAGLTLLGLHSRLKRVENGQVSKEACTLIQARVHGDIKHIKEGQDRVERKVDELVRNGKKKT